MTEVSLPRLYIMRAVYLLIAVGLGIEIWPGLIDHAARWELMHGVVASVLAAVSILAVIGLRYPLQMLPLLLFELIWKSIWLIAVALPRWSAGQIDPDTAETVTACLMGIVVCPIAIPWRYVLANYVMRRGERWA